jgi:hypothetical protein
MKIKTLELFEVNSDIIGLMSSIQHIGWEDVREQSIHRILYLSGVLYAFVYPDEPVPYDNYHFSISNSGPFSIVINNSILDLKRREILTEDSEGNIKLNIGRTKGINLPSSEKSTWFNTVVYILGKYGESKVFGFVIQDPQYKEFFQRNSQMEIDVSLKNKTAKFLNAFKQTFEENLNDVAQIDTKEYLELYFEYIFSKIIKKNN